VGEVNGSKTRENGRGGLRNRRKEGGEERKPYSGWDPPHKILELPLSS